MAIDRTDWLLIEHNGTICLPLGHHPWHDMTHHDISWHIMTKHEISWYIMTFLSYTSWHIMTFCHKNKKHHFFACMHAIRAFLLQKFVITRFSIAFEDLLASSIAPQVMSPCIGVEYVLSMPTVNVYLILLHADQTPCQYSIRPKPQPHPKMNKGFLVKYEQKYKWRCSKRLEQAKFSVVCIV